MLALGLALAQSAAAATAPMPGVPTVGADGQPLPKSLTDLAKPHLASARAIALFRANPKVAAWLHRYPAALTTDATYDKATWTVNVFYTPAGEIATGKVDDLTGAVVEAWTGPQVAWGMARGGTGAFGGAKINTPTVWLGFCAVFLVGLIDWRRPLSLRTVDLLALLSFSVSLWFFNRGDVFTAVPLIYPGFAWLLARCLLIGRRNRGSRGSPVWPVWVLVGVTVFLVGFRVGLNVQDSNVIDVGYSGVIGAERIAHGQSPYGNFPIEGDRLACGPTDSAGEIRERIQTNGRCESANGQGDTYGPVAYEAYLPGYLVFGWSGRWDKLPAVHATSLLWDAICLVGLGLVGRRFGGAKLGATLAFAWAAWPFSQYVSSSNTNDSIEPALLIWGFLFVTSPVARGAFAGLSAWTKFAPLIVLPLWSGYPDARRGRPRVLFLLGFALATAISFSVLLLEPSVWHAAVTAFHRTIGYQVGRSSPFSLWDWRQYHAAGLPDLHILQLILQVMLVAGAVALAWWPRQRSPLQLAAYTAALLIGFESVLTYWIYHYLAWFFPFAALAFLMPVAAGDEQLAPAESDEGAHAPA